MEQAPSLVMLGKESPDSIPIDFWNGRKNSTGKPVLFGTSIDFLTFFGLSTLEDLPDLPEDINEQVAQEEADLFLQVTENDE